MKRIGGHWVFSIVLCILVISPGNLVVHADFIFGTPTNLGPTLNTSARDEEPGVSADGLSLYYCSLRSGGYGNYDLWGAERATTQEGWGPPINLGATVNSSSHDFSPDISSNGLSLYFGSDRPGGYGGYDIWVTRRATTEHAWGTPENLGPLVNSSTGEGCPAISDDGLELYFWSGRPSGQGGGDIWVARRTTTEDDWGAPVNLGALVNGSGNELCMDVVADGLVLFLVSTRAGGYGGTYGDIWITRRPTITDPWGSPVNLGPIVNGPATENGPFFAAEGSTLYFSSDRPGGSGDADMWQVTINPIVDLDRSGLIDIEDLIILIEHWEQDDSMCDIAPPPLGDGRVDVRDLETLMAYWGQEVPDPTLVAHWKLDEAEGIIAFDSAGDNDGTVVGAPLWQPNGGRIDGALDCDGMNDYVETGFAIDPAAGPFSVFAWVKAGAPGQAILSQAGGANWLMTAPDGALMTELKGAGRTGKPLASAANITDGAWHRVGFVWDSTNRILYVDDVEVARDTQTSLAASTGGLLIGADSALTPGAFWSGLIDDVRIYNRVATP